jgi:hypothetical protein
MEGRVDQVSLGRLERADRWVSVRASMMFMPEWARRMTGTAQSGLVTDWFLRPWLALRARTIRWAYPAPPCVEMARVRVMGAESARDVNRDESEVVAAQ